MIGQARTLVRSADPQALAATGVLGPVRCPEHHLPSTTPPTEPPFPPHPPPPLIAALFGCFPRYCEAHPDFLTCPSGPPRPAAPATEAPPGFNTPTIGGSRPAFAKRAAHSASTDALQAALGGAASAEPDTRPSPEECSVRTDVIHGPHPGQEIFRFLEAEDDATLNSKAYRLHDVRIAPPGSVSPPPCDMDEILVVEGGA